MRKLTQPARSPHPHFHRHPHHHHRLAETCLKPHRLARALAASSLLTVALQPVLAQITAPVLPSGATVMAGQAQISTSGGRMTVVNTPQTILNWNSFSIGNGNAVYFQQQGASSAVLNRVTGNDPSSILGSLGSNGRVWLLNPNGVLFGPNARVDVHGLVAGTLNLGDADWLAGRYGFTTAGSGAAVLNQGELRSSFGGTIALLGDSVANEGLVQAPGGQIVLAAGRSIELVDTGAPNLGVRISASAGEARNLGTLQAAGGRIDIHAAAVNQNGIVSADGFASGPGGEVWIKAAGAIELGAASRTSADGASGGSVHAESATARTTLQGSVSAQGSAGQGGAVALLGREVGLLDGATVDVSGALGGGSVHAGGGLRGQDPLYANAEALYFGPQAGILADATGQGNGGRIVLWSNQATRAFGTLSVRGGAQGGNGGFIETSGGWLDARPARVDTAAPHGRSGSWLLDPYDMLISDEVSNEGVSPDFTAIRSGARVASRSIVDALNSGTNVTVSTGGASTGTGTAERGTITVVSATLVASTAAPGNLTLIADGDIDMYSSSLGSSAGPMSIQLLAGRGGAGTIAVYSSTLDVSGNGLAGSAGNTARNISLGGFATGSGPAGGSYTGAASAGISLDNTTVNATGGTVSIAAADGGVALTSSVLTADRVLLQGATTRGSGVLIGGTTSIAATDSITVAGRSQNGSGVLVTEAALVTLAPLAPATGGTSHLMLLRGQGSNAADVAIAPTAYTPPGPERGDGSGSGSGTDAPTAPAAPDAASGAPIVATNGANITFDGPALVQLVSNTVPAIDASAGGGSVLIGSGVVDVSAPILGGALLRFSGTQVAFANNAAVSAAGAIQVAAPSVSIAAGSSLSSSLSASATGDAIVIAGSANAALTGFVNLAGTAALATPGGGRYIVYASDASALGSADAGLDVDFKRVGAAYGGWAGDSGNGLVFAAGRSASANVVIADRVYDGSLNAPIAGATVTVANASASGDRGTLASGTTARYADANAGSAKPASFAGPAVPFLFSDANGTPVYGYSVSTNPLNGNVTRAALSGTASVATRAYDGSTAAAIGIGALSGLVSGEQLVVTASGSFNDKNAGDGKAVSATYAVADGANGLASNYSFSPGTQPLTGTITPRAVSASSVTVASKVYDGSTVATIGIGALSGLVSGEQLVVTASGSFNDKNAGNGKAVSATYAVADGATGLASNYSFSPGTQPLTGAITPRAVSASSVTVASKVYDGSTAATIGIGALSGLVSGEQLVVTAGGSFNDKNAGSGKVVSATYAVADGANGLASNYSFSPGTQPLTGTITPRAVSASSVTVASKVYDGSTAATIGIGALSGLVSGEQLVVSASGSFNDKNAGSGKAVSATYAVSDGANGLASNYSFSPGTQPLTGAITPRAVSASSVTVASKVYDGSTVATISIGALSGLVSGEQLVVTASGSFGDKNAGNGKAVSATYAVSDGANGLASNYGFSASTQPLTATITPLGISAGGLGVSDKVYDGSTAASLSGVARVTPLSGDTLFLQGTATGTFVDRNVGIGKSVSLAGLALGGADAGNYTLAPLGAQTASITPATLQYVAAPVIRSVGLLPTDLSGSVSGFIGTETLADATRGAALFTAQAGADSPAGRYAVLGSGLSALNYRFTQAPANAQALTLVDPEPQTAELLASSVSSLQRVAPVNPVLPPADRRVIFSGINDETTVTAAVRNAAPVGDFGAVRLSSLSADELTSLLAGRRAFMDQLLADSVQRLTLDPAAADLRECETLDQARLGNCLVTAKFKASIAAPELGLAAVPAPALPDAVATAPAAAPAAPPGTADAVLPVRVPVPAPVTTVAPPVPAVVAQSVLRLAASRPAVRSAALPQIERKIALLIGVDRYQDPSIPTLGNAVNDARAVAEVFEKRLGYETVVLDNATKPALVAALNQLALTLRPRDSVIVYYAGHGELVATTQLGYWLLADSVAQQPETWLSNTDIGRLIAQMGASQVALVSDSCYSGSLASEERIRALSAAPDPNAVLDRRSVVVMSSGGNEPVADDGRDGHSPFAWNLMNTLNQLNRWQAGGNVFERVRFAVARTLPQRPQYTASRLAGHQPGGDYLFEQRVLAPGR